MARKRKYDLICQNAECNEPFKGQMGQMYCLECQQSSAVGNENKRKDRLIFGKIDRMLHKNYYVLRSNYDTKNPKNHFLLKKMQIDGLTLDYITEFDKDSEGTSYIFWVYDYGYKMEKEGVLILKK